MSHDRVPLGNIPPARSSLSRRRLLQGAHDPQLGAAHHAFRRRRQVPESHDASLAEIVVSSPDASSTPITMVVTTTSTPTMMKWRLLDAELGIAFHSSS